jgi:hypothetical protein
MASDEENNELARQWYDRKSSLMEASLGKQYDMVSHAIMPFCVGGALDLYYFAEGLPGTAIATKELCELPNDGSKNDAFDCYELVMFTRHLLNLDHSDDKNTAFGNVHSVISSILNCIARYSADATLNPNETCEFPEDMEQVGGRCLIFDGYASHTDEMAGEFGLLAIIEVFPSEMKFARKKGGAKLIQLLKDRGIYPYSDLDREAVA